MPKAIIDTNDIINQKFGKLTVVSYEGVRYTGRNRDHMYKCICDCGNIVDVLGFSLKNGDNTSCGCKNLQNMKCILNNICGHVDIF